MKDTFQQVVDATSDWSVEITPKMAKSIENFSDLLPLNTTVNVTSLPGEDTAETVNVSERLFNDGMHPVPHIAARYTIDRNTLDSFLHALVDRASVDEVLVIGGGVSKPVGEFDDTMSILKSGLLQKHGIKKVGIAGHPEGSPDITEEKLQEALEEKNNFANSGQLDLYVETQICYDSKVILNWEKDIREKGNELPIRIGIPGPANIKTLLRFAKLVGMGNSIKFLARQARNISKLMSIQSPDNLLSGLSEGISRDPECLIQNFHFYSFGGLDKTAMYANSIANGHFLILPSGEFSIKD